MAKKKKKKKNATFSGQLGPNDSDDLATIEILTEGMTVGEVMTLLSKMPPDASLCIETGAGPFCPQKWEDFTFMTDVDDKK